MKPAQPHDLGISTLLDLDGQVLDQGNGYWIKMEAWRVDVSAHVPHGVRYTLTLHEPHGKRILGYDNAHAVSVSSLQDIDKPMTTSTGISTTKVCLMNFKMRFS